MKLFPPYLQLAPRRWGTTRTELGSSHSSWKGTLLLSTPATAACLTCRPDIVCPNRLGGMMQPARAATVRFSLAGSSLPGPRARRARFLTCGVIRVADIKLSRYKGENISLLSLPKKQPCVYQIWRKKLHKFFERSYRINRMNPKYRNQK